MNYELSDIRDMKYTTVEILRRILHAGTTPPEASLMAQMCRAIRSRSTQVRLASRPRLWSFGHGNLRLLSYAVYGSFISSGMVVQRNKGIRRAMAIRKQMRRKLS